MAKMYYSEDETCEALGVDLDGLMELVNSGKLQMYQDGARHVYKASDVDALAQTLQGDAGEAPVELAPEGAADTVETAQTVDAGAEEISLADADEVAPPATPKKEDTVITASGISIFDDEDLEIEEADPMAKTQIAPSLEDQVALEGVGSGSGLLDLTRESDDTSLGAEVLDHIDMEGSGLAGSGLAGSGLAGSGLGSAETQSVAFSAAPVEPPTFVEAVDPASGLFGGILVGAALAAMVVLGAAMSMVQNVESVFVQKIHENLVVVIIVLVVVTLIAAVVGFVLSKSLYQRKSAVQKFG